MEIERKPALALILIARAGVASGGELMALSPSASGDCSPYSFAGSSADGNLLLTNDWCLAPGGSFPEIRGSLFDYSIDPDAPTIIPLGPSFFTDLSGDGRSAAGSVLEQDEFGRERARPRAARSHDRGRHRFPVGPDPRSAHEHRHGGDLLGRPASPSVTSPIP